MECRKKGRSAGMKEGVKGGERSKEDGVNAGGRREGE